MPNDFYNDSGSPATSSQGASATMRAEFAAIEAGFDKLPTLTGNGGKILAVNSGGSAVEALVTTGSGSGVRATSPTFAGTVVAVALTMSGQLTSTLATGTAPLVIASTTKVDNLHVARATLADTATTVTTNANLTGPITSVGNATSIASQTGTGTTFAMSASPTFTGTATADVLIATGNVTLASTAQRIVFNGSAATRADRTLFIEAATNAAINVGAIPNGTGTTAAWTAFGGSDPDNVSALVVSQSATASSINATAFGSGVQRDLVFQIGGVTKLTLDTSFNLTAVGNITGVNLTATGTLAVTGDVAINTNKFNVTAASGNTTVAGTLGVTGAATFSSTLGVTGNVAVNTNKFNVTASSGDTAIAGTLAVTGVSTLTGQVNAAGAVWARNGTATSAGGSLEAFLMGADAVGIYWGSGAPTVVADKGSLYLRTDGTTTNNRAYIATDSGGTWTALTTAA